MIWILSFITELHVHSPLQYHTILHGCYCTRGDRTRWTLLSKMAEVTLIDFLYLNRLALSVEPQFSNQDLRLGLALSPRPFEKSEKRAWYPLFVHVLNFPTFLEFRIVPCYLRVPWRRYMYFAIYLIVYCWQWLFVRKAWILPYCMPFCDFEAKQQH